MKEDIRKRLIEKLLKQIDPERIEEEIAHEVSLATQYDFKKFSEYEDMLLHIRSLYLRLWRHYHDDHDGSMPEEPCEKCIRIITELRDTLKEFHDALDAGNFNAERAHAFLSYYVWGFLQRIMSNLSEGELSHIDKDIASMAGRVLNHWQSLPRDLAREEILREEREIIRIREDKEREYGLEEE